MKRRISELSSYKTAPLEDFKTHGIPVIDEFGILPEE